MNYEQNKPWTEEVEQKLAKQLKGFMNQAVFQGGYHLFAEGYVSEGDWENSVIYNAEIEGSHTDFKVGIHFGFLPFSRCTCRAKGSCSHMAAVICDALYSCDVPVFEFVRKFKLVAEDEAVESRSAAELSARQTATTLEAPKLIDKKLSLIDSAPLTLPESDVLAPWDGYRKWHRLFEKRMPTYASPASEFWRWVELRHGRTTSITLSIEYTLCFMLFDWRIDPSSVTVTDITTRTQENA